MGGCATKPKVLKGDEGEIPGPPPEPTKEPVLMVPEAKDAAHVAAEGQNKVEADVVEAKDVDEAKEAGNDDKVDDQTNKRQSLSNLFKEGSTESDNASSQPMKIESQELVKQESLETGKQESLEPVKQELAESVQIKSMELVKEELQQPDKQATSDTEKLKEADVTMTPETETPAKPIEQTYKPEAVFVAPGKIETEQSIEAKAAPEAATTTVYVPEIKNREISAPGKIKTEQSNEAILAPEAAAAAVNGAETQSKETSADNREGKIVA